MTNHHLRTNMPDLHQKKLAKTKSFYSYTCNPDYEFSDGSQSKTITCQNDGQWSDLNDECRCEKRTSFHNGPYDQLLFVGSDNPHSKKFAQLV